MLFNQIGHAVILTYLDITTRICMVGAKCEAETITISTNFSCFFHMTSMNAFLIFHFLIWTSAWNDLQLVSLSVNDCALLL